MKYSVDMMIDANIDDVFMMYTSQNHFEKWEIGLDRIQSKQKDIFKKNAISFLIFKFNDQEMKMKMTIIDIKKPTMFEVLYEVTGAHNLCKNYFYEDHGQTKWVMDVEFIFDHEVDVPIEKFIDKTKAGMQIFKDYVMNHLNQK